MRDPSASARSSTSASAESASTAAVSRKPADSTTVSAVPRSVESEHRGEIKLEGAPYQLAGLRISLNGLQLHEVPHHRISEWVERIAQVQGPVHFDDLARKVALAAGVQRVGNRIGAAIKQGIDHAGRKGTIRRSGDFVWHVNGGMPIVRDRSGLDVASRKIDCVAPEEIAVAISARSVGSPCISMCASAARKHNVRLANRRPRKGTGGSTHRPCRCARPRSRSYRGRPNGARRAAACRVDHSLCAMNETPREGRCFEGGCSRDRRLLRPSLVYRIAAPCTFPQVTWRAGAWTRSGDCRGS